MWTVYAECERINQSINHTRLVSVPHFNSIFVRALRTAYFSYPISPPQPHPQGERLHLKISPLDICIWRVLSWIHLPFFLGLQKLGQIPKRWSVQWKNLRGALLWCRTTLWIMKLHARLGMINTCPKNSRRYVIPWLKIGELPCSLFCNRPAFV